MGREDWYRRTSWSSDDQQAFFERLNRSRSDHTKSQYLRIQALSLQDTGKRAHLAAAIELLDQMFSECPQRHELASAHMQKGQCLLALGFVDDGLEELRKSLAAMRAHPNVRCMTHLEFGWAVVQHKRRDLIDETHDVLEEFRSESDFLFPVHTYRYFGVVAIIADWLGDSEHAARFAFRAMEAADRDHSGFSRHPRFGLVSEPSGRIHRRLRRLAKNWSPSDATDGEVR